jgi:predicted enzyme related to lactoylglutathione lyase
MATLHSVAPILPTADMERMRRHYERLGFTVRVHRGGYGTASRDGCNLHFALMSGDGTHGGFQGGAVYLAVDNADALHAEWVAAGVGETGELFDPGFGVWEAAHTDADGNLIRFGSPRAHPAE